MASGGAWSGRRTGARVVERGEERLRRLTLRSWRARDTPGRVQERTHQFRCKASAAPKIRGSWPRLTSLVPPAIVIGTSDGCC